MTLSPHVPDLDALAAVGYAGLVLAWRGRYPDGDDSVRGALFPPVAGVPNPVPGPAAR